MRTSAALASPPPTTQNRILARTCACLISRHAPVNSAWIVAEAMLASAAQRIVMKMLGAKAGSARGGALSQIAMQFRGMGAVAGSLRSFQLA